MSLRGEHVLVVTAGYPLSPDDNHGAFVRETVLRLRERGLRFTVFVPAYEASPSHVLDGIRVVRFRYFFKRLETLVRHGAPTKIQRQPLWLVVAGLYIVLGTMQLLRLCRRERPDLLHVHWPFPHGLMAYPAHRILGIPMVFSFHGGELLLARRFSFVAGVLRWLLPRTRGVTCNSTFTRGLIRRLYGGGIEVIPYGMTIEPKPSSPRPAGEPPRILFVGRLDERKGLRYLLEALPIVRHEEPVNLRVVGAGILEEELREQCRRLELEDVVRFLGFVSKEELAREFASCDVFVLPAIVDRKGDTEGLGIVIIEALGHAKPVVACEVGGIPDVVRPGETGLLVPEKDPAALAEAILEILRDPERAKRLGEAGLADIQRRFSWERIVPLWVRIFEEALR